MLSKFQLFHRFRDPSKLPAILRGDRRRAFLTLLGCSAVFLLVSGAVGAYMLGTPTETTPERAADLSIATGYVAVTPAAWQTEKMKKYAQEVPAAAVARDQLQVSVAEFSTHENQRVTKTLNDALQAALTGSKTPQQALTDAQREADRILRSYK